MKITLVRPSMQGRRTSDAMQPLAFAILRALTPPDIEVVAYDERVEPIPLDEPTDLVAMTVETYTARRAFQLATAYRRRGIPVVMGGYHPTFLPEECAAFADTIALGDAEGVWPAIVADARRGRLRPRYQQRDYPPLTGQPPADRTVFKGKKYAPVTLVQYGRGCRFNCDFCSIHAFYGNTLRQRSVRAVCDEIEQAGGKYVFFVDDNLFVDVPKAKELFEAVRTLGINWFCQMSIDIARDRNLVRLMAKSGCSSALFGFESLRAENLRQMRKGWNVKWQDFETSIGVIRDSGIMIYGTFVHGYDHDTVESFDETVEFAIKHRFYLANFNPLTPTPGAPLYDRLAREGRLIHERWWVDPRFRYGDATFHPRGMTAEELTAGCWRARRAFNTAGSMVRRFLDPLGALRTPRNAVQYLLSNAISRRAIFEKQGAALGGPEGLELPQSLGEVPPAAGTRGAAAPRPDDSLFAAAVS